MIEEVFVETCWEEEAIVRARRDARRAELEAQGLKCRTEDLYRVPDWRRVFVVVAETPEVESISALREKKVERVDRSALRREQKRQVNPSQPRIAQASGDNRLSEGSNAEPSAPLNTQKPLVKRRQVKYETR